MESVYRLFSSLFISEAQAVSDKNLVSCGGLDCSVCSALETVSQIINWLFLVSAAAAIALVVLGGLMYIGAEGAEEKMQRAKKWILSAIIGFTLMLVAWLVIHTLFHTFGATYKDSWWKIECEAEPPSVSVLLPVRHPVHLLEAAQKGGNLSAVLAEGTRQEELLDLLNKLPDGKTLTFKLDRGTSAETVIILKKENGKIKLVAGNEKLKDEKQNKKGSRVKQFFPEIARLIFDKASFVRENEAIASTTTDSLEALFANSSDFNSFSSFLELIMRLIEANESIIAILSDTQDQAQRINLCVGSGGSWYRFGSSCELDGGSCPVESQTATATCSTTDTALVDGCKCPAGTCLENNECVPTNDTADVSSSQARCQETGGIWGNYPIFQINAGRCSLFDPAFPYLNNLVFSAGNGTYSDASGYPTSANSYPFIDYTSIDSCVCPSSKCLAEDGGCYPWGYPYPYPEPDPDNDYARSVCSDSGGSWIDRIPAKGQGQERIYADARSVTINQDAEGAYWPMRRGHCQCPTGTSEVYNYKDGFYYTSCELSTTTTVSDEQKTCSDSGGTWMGGTKCTGGIKCLDGSGGFCNCPVGKLTAGNRCFDQSALSTTCSQSGGQWKQIAGLGIATIPQGEIKFTKVCDKSIPDAIGLIYPEILGGTDCLLGAMCDPAGVGYYCKCKENQCQSVGGGCQPSSSTPTEPQKKCEQSGGVWKQFPNSCRAEVQVCGSADPNCTKLWDPVMSCACPVGMCLSSWQCVSGTKGADSSDSSEQTSCTNSGGSWEKSGDPIRYCDGSSVAFHDYWWWGCRCGDGKCLNKTTQKCEVDTSN